MWCPISWRPLFYLTPHEWTLFLPLPLVRAVHSQSVGVTPFTVGMMPKTSHDLTLARDWLSYPEVIILFHSSFRLSLFRSFAGFPPAMFPCVGLRHVYKSPLGSCQSSFSVPFPLPVSH